MVIISALILLKIVTFRIIDSVHVICWGIGHFTVQIAFTNVGENHCEMIVSSQKVY